jgi:hypothetical protein
MIKSRRIRCAGHIECMGVKRNTYGVLVVNPEGKRPLGTSRHRWKDNFKIDLREIGWGCMDWIHPAQDRDQREALVNTVINLLVPYNVGKSLSSKATGGFSRKTRLHGGSFFSSSSALQPGVGFGPPSFLEGFITMIALQGVVVNPTPNPQLFWRTNVFCQGCLL